MKKYIYYLLATILLYSCDNYLDIKPKSRLIPTKATDYENFLNHNLTLSGSFDLVASSDDLLLQIQIPGISFYNAYIFNTSIERADEYPVFWGRSYERINTYNIIINEIDNSTGSESLKASVKAEALLGRAYEYFMLVNSYAKHYDASTANSDLGVPLITISDFNQQVPDRASVQEVYDFILNDINKALLNLPSSNLSFRATKASAYGTLARFYLYQGKYTEALNAANQTLNEYNVLGDYTLNYGTPSYESSFSAAFESQKIYNKRITETNNRGSGYNNWYAASPELIMLFGNGDIRGNVLINKAKGGLINIGRMYESNGPSVPEMYLIKAECNARLNNVTEALKDLNFLRKRRILPAFYTDITLTDKNEVLIEVIKERRRELFLSAIRWFDLKRLNKESQFTKQVIHPLDGKKYILEPNSANYVFPIPIRVLQASPNVKPNPPREVIVPQ